MRLLIRSRRSEQTKEYLENGTLYLRAIFIELYLQFHHVSTGRGTDQACSHVLLGLVQGTHISRVFVMVDDSFVIGPDKETGEDTVEGKQSLLVHQSEIIIREAKFRDISIIQIMMRGFERKLVGIAWDIQIAGQMLPIFEYSPHLRIGYGQQFIIFLMQAELKELIVQKDAIEKEIAQLTTQIQLIDETKQFQHGLVDREGFPRNDINFGELANYRNLKRRKAELNNDHLTLMKVIEGKLFALHATLKPTGEQQWSEETTQPQNAFVKVEKRAKAQEKEEKKEYKIDYLTPFARIGSAEQDSPAWKGGVRQGDLLSEFGEINIYSLDWKKQIAGSVKQGQPVRLVVLRKVQEGNTEASFPVFELKDKQSYWKISLLVVPGRWKGRGLLGCQINPI